MSSLSNSQKNSAQDKKYKHFLDIRDLSKQDLQDMIILGKQMKDMQENRKYPLHPAAPLQGKNVALIFSKPSTRTRVSFEVGIHQLGGHSVVLSTDSMQIGRGETIADTARVLSRFVDAMVLRTGCTDDLLGLAELSSVPVINGLTPTSHPSQIIADIMTFEDHKGSIKGRTLAWLGDGNNVASSLIEAATQFEFALNLATPTNYAPSKEVLEWASKNGGKINVTNDPKEAVRNADAVVTDTWVSMSDSDNEKQARLKALGPYQVNRELMNLAAKDAIFLHCLPAHIGEEVTEEVFESSQSVVFDEAENRLHAHKAILIWSMMGNDWRSYGSK
ncbi:ornithine carbamoyltransferase [Commensalibacter papalotli (ex Servin-Garciduenas et al. 2014)]|uniref:Ornithine carbamoyltransferase n=1 Tax=Commensalibacter papalotli (ex Servin-Garciduenas et al. 2014) TaxID=1208583 RepID=W7DVR5_9PROT|nr:ornithine carbamoyltransferase [Commensalibacter papalotli (ex Servin-Garciduenas et al. 2014)]EUK18323.1 ornithine carbamoyltransferase [Commensalibacter papalotli (ex Servin-Garciduenas et al. 2014)]